MFRTDRHGHESAHPADHCRSPPGTLLKTGRYGSITSRNVNPLFDNEVLYDDTNTNEPLTKLLLNVLPQVLLACLEYVLQNH